MGKEEEEENEQERNRKRKPLKPMKESPAMLQKVKDQPSITSHQLNRLGSQNCFVPVNKEKLLTHITIGHDHPGTEP